MGPDGGTYVFRAVVSVRLQPRVPSRGLMVHLSPFLWLDDHLFNFASFPPIPTGRVPAQALPTADGTTPWI